MSGRVGSCRVVSGRVGSCRIVSGQEVCKYHGSGRVNLIRPDPRRMIRSVKALVLTIFSCRNTKDIYVLVLLFGHHFIIANQQWPTRVPGMPQSPIFLVIWANPALAIKYLVQSNRVVARVKGTNLVYLPPPFLLPVATELTNNV